MELKITDEQLQQIVEKQVEKMLAPRIDKLIKDTFKNRKSLYDRVEECVDGVVREKVGNYVNDKMIEKHINRGYISELVAKNLVQAVSTEIVDTITSEARDY